MKFTAAFKALGYTLLAYRTDWSAAGPHGICMSLWKRETDWKALVMDTRLHAGPLNDWQHKAGNARRIEHAQRALDEFDGWVDVVTIDGIPGDSYGDAHPWRVEDRRKRWRITFLDPVTGHLRLEAQ